MWKQATSRLPPSAAKRQVSNERPLQIDLTLLLNAADLAAERILLSVFILQKLRQFFKSKQRNNTE